MIISVGPDERSNQLIVIATERSCQRVKRMVDQLIGRSQRRRAIRLLRDANCDELAQTLGAVTGVPERPWAGGRSLARADPRRRRRRRRTGAVAQNQNALGDVRIASPDQPR
jgi:hypothetical protein